MPVTTAAEHILKCFILLFFREKYILKFHVNLLPVDDSYEISRLIFTIYKIKKKIECCLLQILLGVLLVYKISAVVQDNVHYENTPIQIYWKFYNQKREIFQIKNSDIFHIFAQNIDCGYSLEPPQWGGFNKYPQSMFLSKIRKIMYTPVNPNFTI